MTFSIKQLFPGLSVVLLTLLSALPWGLPSEARFFLPLLPYTAIHFWAVRRPNLMPEWLVFAAGLATDVLTHGPLGFWSLIFLIGYIMVHLTGRLPFEGVAARWINFCATLLVLSVAQWLIASVYFLDFVEWTPLLRSSVAAALLYPLIGLAFRPLNRLWSRPGNSRLARGV